MNIQRSPLFSLFILGSVVLAVLTAVTYAIEVRAPETAHEYDTTNTTEFTADIRLSVEDTYPTTTVSIKENETVLGVLHRLNAADPSLGLETETYEGMGTLVTKLGEWKNGDDNRYWQYTVNGEMPMVGADVYQLSDGDTLIWSFASSEF